MFYIYGAKNSEATSKAEYLLFATGNLQYRIFILGRDYTIQQLQRLIPGTNKIPHIYYHTQYIGGIKELYEYLFPGIKYEDEEAGDEQ